MSYRLENQRKGFRFLLAVIFSLVNYGFCFGQTRALQADLLKLKTNSDSIVNKYPAEKLYMQFDKPGYTLGDTIWLKTYVLNAASHFLSSRSGWLHVDIANDSNKVIKEYLLLVANGLSWGNIDLDEKTFKAGNYILRAYTNWIRNFGDIFYYKNVRIAGGNENGWLINSKVNFGADNSSVVRAQLQLTGLDKKSVSDSILQVEVTEGKKVMYKQNVQTDKNGFVDVNFVRTSQMNNPVIVVQDKNRTRKSVIPVILNRPENTDVQFMPEGGNLVAGLPAHVGFKAISEDGRGMDVSGIITDHNDSAVAMFRSQYKGIGSFYMNVQPGENYTAKITLPGGTIKTYPLPAVKSSGTILQVRHLSEDSLEVNISAPGDQAGARYFLVGKARGIVCYAAIVNFDKQQSIHSKIAKSRFPSGIVHFTLMTPQGQPLNERLVYIDHHDNLRITIEPDQHVYASKDSVALHINVTDDTGQPIAGDFSIAVTDDAQVKVDSLNDDNISTRLLLTSDLKGYVEEPGYYLEDNQVSKQALDNLLLTQGWVSYLPVDNKMAYSPETEYTIRGIVKDGFNGSIKGTHVQLLSRSPFILMDTISNEEGGFVFHHFPRIDTPVFILKAVNRKGRGFNVDIQMDDYVPPVFIAPGFPKAVPWYLNSDSTIINYVKNNTMHIEQRDIFPEQGRTLNEVQITAKKIIKGSANLNGVGNADIVLDEKDLEAAGKKKWLQLLQENVKGFGETLKTYFTDDHRAVTIHAYFLEQRPVFFIIDGINLTSALPDPGFINVKNYLQSHTAEDIKGIEVMSSAKYVLHYGSSFAWGVPFWTIAYIEITTRSGHGAFSDKTPGMYLYKPIPLSWPKQFYKPKYAVNDTTNRIDLRSTIHWEPNIITDADGKATVSFYAGSTTTTYSVIMQGVDENGILGYKQKKIVIVKQKESAKSK